MLNPEKEEINGLEGKFVQVFWSPVHFPNQPGTMGILCDPAHPALADFPTEMHSNWQWWDILCHAKVIEMNAAPNALLPFIQSIDTYQHNHKLGIGFEAKLHGGKLLVLAIDTENKIDQRPASLQLLQSISNYVRSEAFRPVVDIDEAFVASFLTPQLDNEIKEAVQDEFLNFLQKKGASVCSLPACFCQ